MAVVNDVCVNTTSKSVDVEDCFEAAREVAIQAGEVKVIYRLFCFKKWINYKFTVIAESVLNCASGVL